jgi:FtsP/CotA-like multicopper oxidase with cupredoxin domain
MLKRTLVGGAALAIVAASLLPAASASPLQGAAPAAAETNVGAVVTPVAGGNAVPDLAARLKKAKKDRENQFSQKERMVAAKKSGIKAPTVSAASLAYFNAQQDALAGKKVPNAYRNAVNAKNPNVPHYFGPFANYANSPQHLAVAIVDIAPPPGYDAAAPVAGLRPAAASAIVDDAGVVTGFIVTDPGAGYTSAPAIKVSRLGKAPAGTDAVATASVGAVLDRVDIAAAGVEYNDPATLNFAGGLDPDPAKARAAEGTAVLDFNGTITGVNITDYGMGYVTEPAITITDPVGTGTGGLLKAVMAQGVTAIALVSGGTNYMLPGITKFVDTLPVPGYVNDPGKIKNNLGQYLAIGAPDETTYPGADFYEIAVVQYSEQMHSNLPKTLLRGYVQLTDCSVAGAVKLTNELRNGSLVPAMITNRDGTTRQACGYDNPQYLGPVLAARKDHPVRVLFRNLLPTGVDGDLFLPVDTTVMGSGPGSKVEPTKANNWGLNSAGLGNPQNPDCGFTPKPAGCYSENRATPHLHGGATPWISDGTPHQWITPAGETTDYPAGVSVKNVPDMPDPGPGAMTFFYTNQQSARLMFYHDHAWGITRLNVYAGEAAGYLITDDSEKLLRDNNVIPSGNDTFPLIIQDKTFVPTDAELSVSDPGWDTTAWGGYGQLWLPHTYMPAQNPYDPSGTNQFGRWAYGPWFWPPLTTMMFGPIANPYAGTCVPQMDWCDPTEWKEIPGVPNESMGMEAFADTPMVNGTAYPKFTVDPTAIRFKILNAANDRFFNLQLYRAIGNNAAGDNCTEDGTNCTEVALDQLQVAQAKTDPFVVPNPDTNLSPAGPTWNMLATESGWLAQPTQIPMQPITWVTDPTVFNAGNVDKHSLLLGPAQRADVVVDFSKLAGQTFILYNDAPAAFPARDPRYDYYTDNADLRDTGGANTTPAGYGPNTRTVMEITVRPTCAGTCAPFSLSRANTWWASSKLGGKGIFEKYQNPIVVGQDAYNRAYGTGFNGKGGPGVDGYVRIQDSQFTFKTLPTNGTGGYDAAAAKGATGATVTMDLGAKAMHDEMNAAWDNMYGRMSGNLGLEAPNNQPGLAQNLILYPYPNPVTESFIGLPLADGAYDDGVSAVPVVTQKDGTQIWKITHNGVDSHPIHFHFSDVQLINRVGWDGVIRAPEQSEVGWQDTVRVSPLEDTIVAMRPLLMQTPFGIPVSSRPLNPSLPIGSADGFINVGPDGNCFTDAAGNCLPPITNEKTSFDWEYVWHCHILSHEEMDMMRPITVKAPATKPDAPSVTVNAVTGSADLAWTDGTPWTGVDWADAAASTNQATWGNAKNEVGFKVLRAPVTLAGGKLTYDPNAFTEVFTPLANVVKWTDPSGGLSAAGDPKFVYEVVAWNAAGDATSSAAGLPSAPDAPTTVSATANGKAIDLVWAAPANNGGAAIGGYTISYLRVGSNGTPATATAAAGATTKTLTGLQTGTSYTVTIVATNKVGNSPSATFAGAKTDPSPSAPGPVPAGGSTIQAVAGATARAFTLNWVAPAQWGTLGAFGGLQVQFQVSGQNNWKAVPVVGTVSATTSTLSVTLPSTDASGRNVTRGTRVVISVAAIAGNITTPTSQQQAGTTRNSATVAVP